MCVSSISQISREILADILMDRAPSAKITGFTFGQEPVPGRLPSTVFSLFSYFLFIFFSHQIFSKYSVVLVRKFRGLHSLKPCFFLANVWHNVEYAQVCQRLQCGNCSLASQNVSHGHFCSHSCSAIIRASNQNIYLFSILSSLHSRFSNLKFQICSTQVKKKLVSCRTLVRCENMYLLNDIKMSFESYFIFQFDLAADLYCQLLRN